MTTRVIRITECSQCPFRFVHNYERIYGFEYGCQLHSTPPLCPPTGTPDWCPLEAIEDAGGVK